MKTILFSFTAILLFTSASLFAQAKADTILANDYFAKGEAYLKKAKYDSSNIFFGKAAEIYKTKKLWANYVKCLNKIGKNYNNLGNNNEAMKILNNALSIGIKNLGAEHPDVAMSYNNIGAVYYKNDEYNKALEYYHKSLDIRLKSLGPEHSDVAGSYNNIGLVYDYKGEYKEALEYQQKSLDIRLKSLGPEHPVIAGSYNNIGNAYLGKGEFDKALEYYHKSLDIRLKSLGPENPVVAMSYNNIGLVYKNKGEYDKALEYHHKSLDIRLKSLGPEHSDVADSYNNIGLVYRSNGEFDKALEYQQKSLDIRLKSLGPEHSDVAGSYNNIGSVYNDKGEYDKAFEYFQKSLDILLKLWGHEHPHVAVSYNNIGNIFDDKGEFDKALEYQQKSLDIKLKSFGPEHPEVAMSYTNIGYVYKNKGEYDKALEYHQKSLNICLKSFGPEHPLVAFSYNSIGIGYSDKGEYDKALEHYQKALGAVVKDYHDSIYANNPDLNRPILSELILLAILKSKSLCLLQYYRQTLDLKDLEASVITSKLAVQLIDKIRSSYQSESSKLFLGEQSYEIFETGVRCAAMMHQITNDEKYKKLSSWFAEKSKAGVLLESLNDTKAKSYAGIPDSVLNYEKSLRNELIAYDKHLTEELGKGKDANQQRLSTLQNKIFELKRKFEDHVKLLEQNYPSYFTLKYQSKISSVDDIQKNLPDKSIAVIEYFLTKDSLYIFSISQKQYDITIVHKDSLFDSKVKLLRNLLTKGKVTDWRNYAETSNELYHLLIKPLPLSSNINQLVIVPDGILSLIPFESLVTEPLKGNERGYENLKYLIQKYAISYSYSATLYEESLHKVVSQAKNEYIGFAPVFSKESKAGYVAKSHAIFLSDSAGTTRGLIDRNNITAIPGTKDEVIAVFDQFSKKQKKAEIYTFQKANEDNLKKEILSDYKYIHFATHGFVNEDQPALSGIILAQDTSIVEDGVLYAGEVYGLELDAESVILSACETGLGKQVRGEGIIGLTRGFLYAGARSVVVSLWQVADESTSKLMQDMFKRLSDDKNSYDHRAKLLRESKLKMIKDKQYAMPFYWSPFVLIGK